MLVVLILKVIMQIVLMLTVFMTVTLFDAECHILFSIMLNVIMLIALMLNVIMLIVLIPNVIILIVLMLNVIMPSVAALKNLDKKKHFLKFQNDLFRFDQPSSYLDLRFTRPYY